jgi:hypothetical protein
MTEQYAQRNINNPEGARSAANSVAEPDFALTAADVGKALVFDTTLAAGIATLPSATEAGAGAEITLIAATGATFGLTVAAAAGDQLVAPAGAPANPAVTDNASFTVRSDGGTNWYITAGLA